MKCPECDGRGGEYWTAQWSDGLGGGFTDCFVCKGDREVTVETLIEKLKAAEVTRKAQQVKAFTDFDAERAKLVDIYVVATQYKQTSAKVAAEIKKVLPDGYLAHKTTPGYVHRCVDGTEIHLV